MNKDLLTYVIDAQQHRALMFGTNIGASMINKTLPVVYTDENAQFDAINAFCENFDCDFVTIAMDLSIEAECFGGQVKYLGNSAPVITGRILTDTSLIDKIAVPEVGERRTKFSLNILERVIKKYRDIPVIAGTIGPFTLAGRIFGVSEILELVLLDPAAAHALVGKCNQFIEKYILSMKSLGADGVLLAEPSAGLLSPRLLGEFSSAYIKELVDEVESPFFKIVYHNCAATIAHFSQILDSGVSIMHFGEPMDIPLSLGKSPENRIISGNLDPSRVFLLEDLDTFEKSIRELLSHTSNHSNFLISSGCDLPADISLEKIKLLYALVRQNHI